MNPRKQYSLHMNAGSVQLWKDGKYFASLNAKELYELLEFKKATLTKAQLIQEIGASVMNETKATLTKGENW